MAFLPFRHFGLKVLSILLAVVLWILVSGEQVAERGMRVPLEFQNLPPSLELVGQLPDGVDVRLRGTSGALSSLTPADVTAMVDLKTARPGRRLFHLTTEQVKSPFGIDVVQVTPATVALTFEPASVRDVPIRPQTEGDPAPGYVVGQITAEPAMARVIGPVSAVRALREAITEPVDIGGAAADVRETVNVGVPDPSVRLTSQLTAVVRVGIRPAPVERALTGVPVHLRGVAPRLSARAEPSSVTVRVRGSRERLQRLRTDDVQLYVDLSGLGAGRYELPIRAEAPSDFGIAAIEPGVVQITLR